MNNLYVNIIIIFIIVIVFFSITYFFNKKRSETFNEIDNLINQLKEHETIIKTRKDSEKKKEELDDKENNSKINVLIENMGYAEDFTRIAKNEFDIKVKKKSSKDILRFLEEKNLGKKQTLIDILKDNNIVSFPYWTINELINEEKIIKPLKKLIDDKALKKLNFEYPSTIKYVKNNNEVYGIPFSKITALIAYNNKVFDSKPSNYEEIIKKIKGSEQFNFSMYCSVESRSYFYYFFILCGSYGILPFIESGNAIKHKLNSKKSDKALAVLLELLKYSLKSYGSWNEPLNQLLDETSQASFIWSEQLSQIVINEDVDIGYRGTPVYDKDNFFNIFEGWFLALIDSEVNDSRVAENMRELGECTIKSKIIGQTFSSPLGGNNYKSFIYSIVSNQKYSKDIEVKIATAVEYVNDLFQKSEPIPNTTNFGKVMYEFSKVFDDNSSYIDENGGDGLKFIKEKLFEKLSKLNIEEYE